MGLFSCHEGNAAPLEGSSAGVEQGTAVLCAEWKGQGGWFVGSDTVLARWGSVPSSLGMREGKLLPEVGRC